MSDRERQPDLELKLAEFVCTYIAAACGDDLSQEPEALRWLCCGLEYFLGEQLEGSDGWNGWVDGILPATDILPEAIKVVSPIEVSLRGSALWRMHHGPSWIEPFFGTVRISASGDSIIGYELHFGDAARGLGTIPYDKHIRWENWFYPKDWLFSFSKGPDRSARLQ